MEVVYFLWIIRHPQRIVSPKATIFIYFLFIFYCFSFFNDYLCLVTNKFIDMKKMSLAEYVHSFGMKVSDLSKYKLRLVMDELDAINDGYIVNDGILSRPLSIVSVPPSNLGEWLSTFDLVVSDLNEEELEEANKEFGIVLSKGEDYDPLGMFSHELVYSILERKESSN